MFKQHVLYLESGTASAVDWVLMALDSNHNPVTAVVPNPWSVTTAGAWTYETGSYQVPANVAYVYFYANVYQSSGTTTARFDDGFAIFGTHYFHPDQLSTRLTTDATGVVIGQQGHFPFGESWYAQNTTTNWQFTSYQRDAESGNDYAMARSYINRLARFSSPDPADFTAANPSNPQSWNRYAYVTNLPLSLADPLGLDPNGGSCDGAVTCMQAPGCDGFWQLGPCMPSGPQLWLTITNFACWYFVTCHGGSGVSAPQSAGGGISGSGSASGTNSPNNNPSQQSHAQQSQACTDTYNNSPYGKGTKFFSLYNLATNFRSAWKEWLLYPSAKLVTASALKAGTQAVGNTEFLSLTGGASTVVTAPTAAGIETTEATLGPLAPFVIAGATVVDVAAHAQCKFDPSLPPEGIPVGPK
jgi:RHS repeat-associated protein